ncbi:YfhE family protein [Bacillus infantis]|jgi:hypothetical protein|uniref:YfhE family protein n=1 Tax=Bacillus infantis TaxID=324767 RepID=UPI00101C097A|nr:YfhE family protein [Bacillus infantis]MCA1042256.1 YfhE family protein [Bacillus infantis]MCR6609161.1 YfhE family protein [Bacillus infantis]RYI27001.1 YfhE family protein [Bacillus infantis]
MADKKAPYKGFNTEQNNGLSDAQEVNYSSDFKKAYKAEKKQDSDSSEKSE